MYRFVCLSSFCMSLCVFSEIALTNVVVALFISWSMSVNLLPVSALVSLRLLPISCSEKKVGRESFFARLVSN